MEFTLTINTDNAAFEGDNAATEIARVLNYLANQLEIGRGIISPMPLFDTNGNRVGQVFWDRADDDGSLWSPQRALRALVEAHDEEPPMLTEVEWDAGRKALEEPV